MGFRCEVSGKHVQGSPKRVLAQTREKRYPERFRTVKGEHGPEYKCIDPGGRGWETVKELLVDPLLPPDKIEKFIKGHKWE